MKKDICLCISITNSNEALQDYFVFLISILNTPICRKKNSEDTNYYVKKILDAIENSAILNYKKVKD